MPITFPSTASSGLLSLSQLPLRDPEPKGDHLLGPLKIGTKLGKPKGQKSKGRLWTTGLFLMSTVIMPEASLFKQHRVCSSSTRSIRRTLHHAKSVEQQLKLNSIFTYLPPINGRNPMFEKVLVWTNLKNLKGTMSRTSGSGVCFEGKLILSPRGFLGTSSKSTAQVHST